jgi:3-hydroxybutyryl-CoA dehydrogenase
MKNAPKMPTPDSRAQVESLLVVGAGVMGQGIARLFADADISVTLTDTSQIDFSHPGVTVVREAPEAIPDLVIEAVFEDPAVKQSVYADIEARYAGGPVLATNTSGLPLDELAGDLKYPHRFLAMHFFMPAEVFPMIEVVRGTRTEDAAMNLAIRAVRHVHREPIVLQRPVTGYLINRLQHSILHEAYYLVEEGVATPDTIDKVAKWLLGPRLCVTGLLEQKDIAGLGMHAQAQRSIVPSLAHTGVPSALLQNMVARGDVGIRSGRGFYEWRGRDAEDIQRRAEEKLRRLLTFLEAEAGNRPV